MKIKYLSMLLLVALLGCSAAFARGSIHVNFADKSSPREYDLTESLMFTFSKPAALLYVHTGAEGAAEGFSLKNVESITFSDKAAAVEALPGAEGGVKLRNNPVQDELRFAGAPELPCTLSIYSLQGSQLLSLKGWQGENVDVSFLAPGLYILHFNTNSFKFIKK